ncbi:MAG: hypothetical protein ACPHFV_04630 [Poseidonia sp.]
MSNTKALASLLLVCMLASAWPVTWSSLEEDPAILRSGTPDRVVIDAPPATMSADEVVMFEAIIYDAVNNVVAGNIAWSAANGSIDDDGLFFPWSSGVIEIIAEHNGLKASHNITVYPGVATDIEITSLTFGARETATLTADLLDGRGNRMAGSTGLVWDIDGSYIGHDTPEWTPDATGLYTARVRFNQLQDVATLTVRAGQPHAFVFDEPVSVRAGTWTSILPRLVDINGYEMAVSEAGPIAWFAQNGTFNAQGEYHAINTGKWLISATAGNITGSTMLSVIPGDAVASELMFANAPETFLAGESYEVLFERRDSNGYIGMVSPSIETLTASSGGLSVDDEQRVYWNPSSTGQATLSGTDGTVSSSITVNVEHGRAIDLRFLITPSNPSAGDQVVVELQAEDVKGNRWVVNGNITMTMGDADAVSDQTSYSLVQATVARSWRFDGSWFDNTTGAMFVSDIAFDIRTGRLAFITLEGEGSQVPADGELELNPMFFDAHGNQLDDIALNWSLDGKDITLQMLLNDGRWVATSLGGHELRVNADGVFATVRLTVVAGTAHALQTDVEDRLIVQAGKPFDVFIQVVDVHGNVAESTAVSTTMNTSIGELETSPTGLGYWQFVGKQVGDYELVLQESGAEYVLPVTIEAGTPVRIQAGMSRDAIAEGDVVLMNAFGTDVYGNTLSIPNANTSVTCTAGDVRFVTNGTWEVDVNNGGTDRSCTIRWNGLLAQTFFDVDEVLLGGAVGSTNTAMTMAALLLGLLLAVLVVLARKAAEVEKEAWVDDVFDDEEYEDEEEPLSAGVVDDTPIHERHGLSDDSMKALAQEAGRLGVMQATPSTVQGQTGWYVDVSEELQYWEVTPSGEWIRHE